MSDLRDHLFEVIERLKLNNDPEADDKEKISIDTAQAICNCSQAIINSAKLEIDAIKIIAKEGLSEQLENALTNSTVIMLQKSNQSH